jgi:hypothetical protein
MKRMTSHRRPKIEIADLAPAAEPLRELGIRDLVAVSGGRPDTGYVCSAPSNDCSKE